MRKTDVHIIDDAKDAFEELNRVAGEQRAKDRESSEEQQLLKSIKAKVEILKENPAYGDKIPQNLWPKELVQKYNLTNLWRVELTNFWRMLYTLRGDRVEVICFIIKLTDHKEYNRMFRYKGK